MSSFAFAHDPADDDETLEQRYRDQIAAALSDDPQDETRNAEIIAALYAEAQRVAEHRRVARTRCAERMMARLVGARRTRGSAPP